MKRPDSAKKTGSAKIRLAKQDRLLKELQYAFGARSRVETLRFLRLFRDVVHDSDRRATARGVSGGAR